jgi:hypothetical protein
VEHVTGLHSEGRLVVLAANVRLGLKWLKLKSALAYYGIESMAIGIRFDSDVYVVKINTSLHQKYL